MYLKKSHYIRLHTEDITQIVGWARDIDQGISRDEYIEKIESLLGSVVLMMESELTPEDIKE